MTAFNSLRPALLLVAISAPSLLVVMFVFVIAVPVIVRMDDPVGMFVRMPVFDVPRVLR